MSSNANCAIVNSPYKLKCWRAPFHIPPSTEEKCCMGRGGGESEYVKLLNVLVGRVEAPAVRKLTLHTHSPHPPYRTVKKSTAPYKGHNIRLQCNHTYCAADFSLLNLPKGKSLGRSKPATNS